MDCIWRMLQADTADDFVIATGKTHSVRDYVQAAFAAADIDVEFAGTGVGEVGRRSDTGDVVVVVSPKFYRPVDAANLVGNADKAAKQLNWRAQTWVPELARLMVEADLRLLERGP